MIWYHVPFSAPLCSLKSILTPIECSWYRRFVVYALDNSGDSSHQIVGLDMLAGQHCKTT
jgi:hypothetical protein